MVTDTNIVGRQKDLSSSLGLSNPNRTPLLSNLTSLGKVRSINNTVSSWVDYQVINTKSTLDGAIDDTVTTVNVEAGTGEVFEAGQLIRVESEIMEITSVATDALTVTRGQKGTSAAAHADNLEVFVVAEGIAEGSDFKEDKFKEGANFLNYTQIVKTGLKVSGTQAAITVPSNDNKSVWDLEAIRKEKKHEGKLEEMIMQGVAYVSGDERGCGGLTHFLDSGVVVNASAGAISLDLINSLLLPLYNRGAELDMETYVMIVPPVQKNKISKLLKDYVTAEPRAGEVLGQVVNYIDTDYGMFPLMMSNNLPADEIWIVNLDEITLRPQVGEGATDTFIDPNRTKQYNPMGKKGDYYEAEYLTEMTLEIRRVDLQGKLVNLAR